MHSAIFQGLKTEVSEYFSIKHNFIVLGELQFTSTVAAQDIAVVW